ncbi:MAG: hypothetical protein R3C03_24080 [Pirellulaceae bacterium]
MNVAELTVDQKVAREKLRAYRSRRHKDAEQEYQAAEKLFEAAACGHRLIVADDVIRNSEFDQHGRPRLAIARADRKQVVLYRWKNKLRFDSRASFNPYDKFHENLIHDFNNMPTFQTSSFGTYDRWFTTVPMVPADVRPQTGQLRHWHILWEVDAWHERPIIDPPRDPYLLEHVSGNVFAVIAEWDLTPLEREAMKLAIR